MGLVAGNYCFAPKAFLIKGKVINEKGEALPFASVQIDGTNDGVSADSLGRFEINGQSKSYQVSLTASSVGYSPISRVFNLTQEDIRNISLILNEQSLLGEVSVTSFATKGEVQMVGRMFSVTPVTFIDTAKTFINKAFKNEMFRVYPNPISGNEPLQIVLAKAGEYSISIFDNSGKLYLAKQLEVSSKNQKFPLSLPSELARGIYYIKAINTKTRKQFIDKIIVH
jgi:hypothetical protein